MGLIQRRRPSTSNRACGAHESNRLAELRPLRYASLRLGTRRAGCATLRRCSVAHDLAGRRDPHPAAVLGMVREGAAQVAKAGGLAIEFNRGLVTSAKRWSWRDDDVLASCADKHAAVVAVRFPRAGCAS